VKSLGKGVYSTIWGFWAMRHGMANVKWRSKVRDKPRGIDDEMIQYTIIAHVDMDSGAS
jgi:hypothetical protein